jgi:hypothetical protein
MKDDGRHRNIVVPRPSPCIISTSSRLRDDGRANRGAPGAERGIADVVLVVLVGIVSAGWRPAQSRHELSQLVGIGRVVNAFRDDG